MCKKFNSNYLRCFEDRPGLGWIGCPILYIRYLAGNVALEWSHHDTYQVDIKNAVKCWIFFCISPVSTLEMYHDAHSSHKQGHWISIVNLKNSKKLQSKQPSSILICQLSPASSFSKFPNYFMETDTELMITLTIIGRPSVISMSQMLRKSQH